MSNSWVIHSAQCSSVVHVSYIILSSRFGDCESLIEMLRCLYLYVYLCVYLYVYLKYKFRCMIPSATYIVFTQNCVIFVLKNDMVRSVISVSCAAYTQNGIAFMLCKSGD